MRTVIALVLMLVAAMPAHAAAIPAAFWGNWAPDLAECRDVDQVRVMHIRRDLVSFYEAETIKGTLKILRSTTTELVLTNRMRGEGRRFPVTLRLRLSDNRARLTWTGFGRDPSDASVYVKCPS